MSSTIRNNNGIPAAAPQAKVADSGGISFGSFALAGTAAMMSQILELLQELCKVENVYNELTKCDIDLGTTACNSAFNAAQQAGSDQAQATRFQGMSQAISGVGAIGGFIGAGVGYLRVGGTSKIDQQININDNLSTKITEELASTGPAELNLRGTAADGSPVDFDINHADNAGIKSIVTRLKQGSFGQEGNEGFNFENADFKKAVSYLKQTDTGELLRVRDQARTNSQNLNNKKDVMMRQRESYQQMGSSFGQMTGAAAQTVTQYQAATYQSNQGNDEASKVAAQNLQQQAQTVQSQGVSGRDAKDQQISQVLQSLQSAIAANQIN